MAVHFSPAESKSNQQKTADCVSVVSDVPEHLEKAYSYEQGQNITLKTIDGEKLRRSYSVCNAPAWKELKVAIKKVEGGKFSAFANDILVNLGMNWKCPPRQIQHSTGCFRIKNYLALRRQRYHLLFHWSKPPAYAEPGSSFTLVFGNRSRASIIFEELEAIKNKYLDRFSLINILSRSGQNRQINFGKIDEVKTHWTGKAC